MAALPGRLQHDSGGANGETLSFDEAEVWKRVLDYRIAQYLKPKRIIETHRGRGVATRVFRIAAPQAKIVSADRFQTDLDGCEPAQLIDIDPFGFHYEALSYALPLLDRKHHCVLMVTNGEMMTITRGLRGQVEYKGIKALDWVKNVFLPELEESSGLTAQFHYAFPTTVRAVLSNRRLPKSLFDGCPQLMSWLRQDKRKGFLD